MFVASWKLAFASKRRRSEPFASHVSQCRRMGYAPPPIEGLEVTMAKGQMRSNREKKKPKQDKNKKKGAEGPSQFAACTARSNPAPRT